MKNLDGLKSFFEELRQALRKCDTAELDRLTSDDFVGFSLHGTIESKKDIIDNYKPGIITISEYSVVNESYEVFDNIGIITGQGVVAGTFKQFSFHHAVLFTDIFKYVDGQWTYYKSQITEKNDGPQPKTT